MSQSAAYEEQEPTLLDLTDGTGSIVPFAQMEQSRHNILEAVLAQTEGFKPFTREETKAIEHLRPMSVHLVNNTLHHNYGQTHYANMYETYLKINGQLRLEMAKAKPNATLVHELGLQEARASVITQPYRNNMLYVLDYARRYQRDFVTDDNTDYDLVEQLFDDTAGYDHYTVLAGIEQAKALMPTQPDAVFAEARRFTRLMLLDTFGPKPAA